MSTPDSLLQLQFDITSTVSCSGTPSNLQYPALPGRFINDEFDISFSIPENWRTNPYSSSQWFPDGQTLTNGTLWTLLTDAEKHVEHFWWDGEEELSESVFRRLASQVEGTRPGPYDGIVSIGDLVLESVEERDGYLIGQGRLAYTFRLEDQEDTEPYQHLSLMWRDGGRTHLLVAAIVARTEIWQRPTDLTPYSGTLEDFLFEQLLPNVPSFKGDYH